MTRCRIDRAILTGLAFSLSLTILAATQAQPRKSARRPERPLFGVTRGDWPTDSEDKATTGTGLRVARRAGATRFWLVEPTGWPMAFTTAALHPSADGTPSSFDALDGLAKEASRSGAQLVPVLDMSDLIRLGASQMGEKTPSARARFLASLAGHRAEAAKDAAAQEQFFWQIRIPVHATPDGPRPEDVRQLATDAATILGRLSTSSIIADIGEFSTAATAAEAGRVRALASGPARATLQGIGVKFSLEEPNFATILAAFARLSGAATGIPVWTNGIRASKAFESAAARLLPAGDPWAVDSVAAAYASALGAYAIAGSNGGAVLWEDAPATDTLRLGDPPISPMARAAGRLSRLIRPYSVPGEDRNGQVYTIALRRDPEPETLVVFWDWASDPDYRPGKTIPFRAPVQSNLYRVTPLVDDPPLWGASREIKASPLGLSLDLGRTPLVIERAHIGRAVPAPLGPPPRNSPQPRRQNDPALGNIRETPSP